MYKTKLCLGTSVSFGISDEEQIRMFAEAGFEAFFTEWQHWCNIKEWKKTADECGIRYHFVHAPFTKMKYMWEKNDYTEVSVRELKHCIRDCSENEIDLIVLHAFIGFDKHSPNEMGIENFGQVVDYAREMGVRVAFENTEGEEYLDKLMSAFASDSNVGFCWDTGHEMCYNRNRDMLADYGTRLFCTHINDNLGIRDFDGAITWKDDLHLLPYDGVADWTRNAKRLAECKFDEVLTFELTTKSKPDRHENDKYATIPIRQYLAEAYSRACRFATEYNKYRG